MASVLTLVGTTTTVATARPTVKVAAAAKSGPKPGLAGKMITLAVHASFDGDNRAWDLGADKSGTAYMAWLAAKKNSPTLRDLFFCTLPLGATRCKGGVQDITTPDSASVAGLRLLVSPSGLATVLWYASDNTPSGILESTSEKGGTLTTPKFVVNGPSAGALLDAEFGPNGDIWTVVQTAVDGKVLNIRRSLTAAPETVKAPASAAFIGVGFANLAFAGKTPILAITNVGQDTPPLYTYPNGSSWRPFKKIAGTITAFIDISLTATRSGVRLTAASAHFPFQPVTASWNGHGFTKPVYTGDHNDFKPGSHDTSSDASGRMVDVADEGGVIAVANLADTRHAAIFRFGEPKNATPAGGDPQIVSTPRGHAWVAWGVESSAAGGNGDTLKVVPVLLAGLENHKSSHGAHGTIVITGPTSCQPASSIKVGVKGNGAKGWRVVKHTLKLGKKKIGTTLNGAALTPGKVYTLIGSVVFSNGHGHSSAKASLKFKACPRP
jgi:hypothetical protein